MNPLFAWVNVIANRCMLLLGLPISSPIKQWPAFKQAFRLRSCRVSCTPLFSSASSGTRLSSARLLAAHQVPLEPLNRRGRRLGEPRFGVGVEVLAALQNNQLLGLQCSLVGRDGHVRRR